MTGGSKLKKRKVATTPGGKTKFSKPEAAVIRRAQVGAGDAMDEDHIEIICYIPTDIVDVDNDMPSITHTSKRETLMTKSVQKFKNPNFVWLC